jgi:predicted Zn-dependent protease
MRRAASYPLLCTLAVTLACSVSSNEERELGVEMSARVDSQLPLVRDTVVLAFVKDLGHSMAARTSRADLDWQFAVVNTDAVNAFALPGGFVYVTRGALERADRFDEIAGVLAHEIGHVVRRHSVKQIEQAEKRDVGVVLLCTLTRVCSSIGGVIAVRTARDAMTARYSQRDELEADAEAVSIARAGNIDPEGLPSFLRKILESRTTQPTPVDAFFATHPTDESRIAALQAQIRRLPRGGQPLTKDKPEFHAVQEHLRTLPAPPRDTAAVPTSAR